MSRARLTLALAIFSLALPGSLSLDSGSSHNGGISTHILTKIGVLPTELQQQLEPSTQSLAALRRVSTNAEAIAQAQELKAAQAVDRTGTIHNLFVAWSQQYNKHYDDVEQARTALGAFTQFVDVVIRQNLKATHGAWFSFNELSGTPRRKMQATLAKSPPSAAPSPGKRTRRPFVCTPQLKAKKLCFGGSNLTKGVHAGAAPSVPITNLPKSLNWVTKGRVSPVKDQGQSCSSCWAFSAITTIEAAIAIVYKKAAPSLSRQIILDCANGDIAGPDYAANGGCYMGDASSAILFPYYYTIPLDKYYPYTASTGTCNQTFMNLKWNFQDFVQGFQVNYYPTGSEIQLQGAVSKQPVVIYWSLGNNFWSYSSGVYTVVQQTDEYDGCFNDAESTNHAMVVVGYDVSKNNSRYWIIQNSWGTSWGMKGFANVEMTGDKYGPCAMYAYVVAPVMAFKHVPPAYKYINPKSNVWTRFSTPIAAGNHTDAFPSSQCAQSTGNHSNCNQASSVAISPDSALVAVGVWDYAVRIYSVSSHRLLFTFLGHTDRVTSVTFSADGAYLASGSADGTVKIWDVLHWVPTAVFTLTNHIKSVNALAFSPDGTTLASGSDDTTVGLWDVTAVNNTLTTAPPFIKKATGHVQAVNAVAWSADSQSLLSGSSDLTIRLWARNTSYSKVGYTYAAFSVGGVTSVSISVDGKSMVSGGMDHVVRLWNLTSFGDGATSMGWYQGGNSATDPSYSFKGLRTTFTNTSHTDRVSSCTFSPDGQLVVSGGFDKVLRVFNTTSFKQVIALSEFTDAVTSVAFSSDGGTIIAASYSGQVRFYTLQAPSSPPPGKRGQAQK